MSAETPQQKITLEQAQKTSFTDSIPLDENGWPLLQISWSAAELIPTRQYGNVTSGPVMVRRYIKDGDSEYLLSELRKLAEVCEKAVSEDRETIHFQLRQSEQGRVMP